jgi:hypothetical protein
MNPLLHRVQHYPWAFGDSDDQDKKDDDQKAVTPKTWEEILSGLDPEVQTIYTEHHAGLKRTITAVREERDGLSSELKKLSKTLAKHPEVQAQVDTLTASLDAANARADFYAEAPAAGCINPKAAYALMQAEKLIDKKGQPDWEALAEAAPQLFQDVDSVDSDPGEGHSRSTSKSGPPSMNSLIRSAVRGGRVSNKKR